MKKLQGSSQTSIGSCKIKRTGQNPIFLDERVIRKVTHNSLDLYKLKEQVTIKHDRIFLVNIFSKNIELPSSLYLDQFNLNSITFYSTIH